MMLFSQFSQQLDDLEEIDTLAPGTCTARQTVM